MSLHEPKVLDLPFEKLSKLTERLDFFNTLVIHQRIKVLKQLSGEIFVYSEGQIIIEEGSSENELFIILSGSVNVLKGKEQFTSVGTIKAGDFFGEISFIMRSKRTASVVANEKTIVLRLSQDNFSTLDIMVQSLMKDKVMIKLVTRLNNMNHAVIKLLNKLDKED
ncbi:MAG: cyclic nucleotide-binding domain-containing protein [Thiovulaceae bacterium]|nr:cyclic nucleotide-binding domain-containing protein [Sulfurimonadaceae bacterium]